jgi:PBP1b-binding outer membrane lipoprotein LpoB
MVNPELFSSHDSELRPSVGTDATLLHQSKTNEGFLAKNAAAGGGLSSQERSEHTIPPLQRGGEQQQETVQEIPRFKSSDTVIYSITLADGTQRTRIPRIHLATD